MNTTIHRQTLLLAAMLASPAACAEADPPTPDGVDVPLGPCGHALYVLSTDYQSTSVAILGYDGEVLATSLVSSGSETSGLSTPLSGDVVAPTIRTSRGELILLDRSEASILSFVDPVTATVERQISVQTGFRSNPQDVVELGDRAYVSRYQMNPGPGQEPYDDGSDLLVLDLIGGGITRRIDLAAAMDGAEPGTLPSPSRMVVAQERIFVLLAALSQSFQATDDSRVAVIDPASDEVVGRVIVSGSRGCSALALSPNGERLAVGCSGSFVETSPGVIGSVLAESGISLLRIDGGELSLEQRIAASELGDDPVSFSLAFADDDTLIASTFGQLADDGTQARPDRLLAIDVDTGEALELLSTLEKPFSLGDVRCEPTCGACFAADADRRVVHRFAIEGGTVGARTAIAIDDGIGLPPRYLGAY